MSANIATKEQSEKATNALVDILEAFGEDPVTVNAVHFENGGHDITVRHTDKSGLRDSAYFAPLSHKTVQKRLAEVSDAAE